MALRFVVIDFTAHLLNVCGCGDGRDEILQVFLEFLNIMDNEEQEILKALRDTQTVS